MLRVRKMSLGIDKKGMIDWEGNRGRGRWASPSPLLPGSLPLSRWQVQTEENMLGKKRLAPKDPTFLPSVLCGQHKAAPWSLSQHSKTFPDSSMSSVAHLCWEYICFSGFSCVRIWTRHETFFSSCFLTASFLPMQQSNFRLKRSLGISSRFCLLSSLVGWWQMPGVW